MSAVFSRRPWGRNECVTNEPQRTSAGRLPLIVNRKKMAHISLDQISDDNVATIKSVKELIPFTKNILYRKYFSEFYDFANADSYGINIGSSGVIINSLKPNITLPPNKDLSEIEYRGLNVNGYDVIYQT